VRQHDHPVGTAVAEVVDGRGGRRNRVGDRHRLRAGVFPDGPRVGDADEPDPRPVPRGQGRPLDALSGRERSAVRFGQEVRRHPRLGCVGDDVPERAGARVEVVVPERGDVGRDRPEERPDVPALRLHRQQSGSDGVAGPADDRRVVAAFPEQPGQSPDPLGVVVRVLDVGVVEESRTHAGIVGPGGRPGRTKP